MENSIGNSVFRRRLFRKRNLNPDSLFYKHYWKIRISIFLIFLIFLISVKYFRK